MGDFHVFYYFLAFLVPAFLLLALSNIIIARSYHVIEGKLITLALYMYFFSFVFEFIRHIFPITYSSFILQFLAIPFNLLGLSICVHVVYIFLNKRLNVHILFSPYIYYLPFILYFMTLPLGAYLTVNDFYQDGIWYYRSAPLTHLVSLQIYGVTVIGILILIMIGWRKSVQQKNENHRSMFQMLLIGSAVSVMIFIVFLAFFQKMHLPPAPAMYVGVVAAIMIAISEMKYDFTPSIGERYQLMINLSPIAIYLLSKNFELIEHNAKASSMIDHWFEQKYFEQFSNRPVLRQIDQLKKELDRNGTVTDFVMTEQRNGRKKYWSIDASTIRVAGEKNYYVMARDVTAEVEQETLIRQQAYFDPLTNIYNRTYFDQQVFQALKEQQEEIQSGLIISDLNFFKVINDTYGHSVGDEVLIHTAKVLQQFVQEPNVLARLGGDEFVIFIRNVRSEQQMWDLVYTMREAFREQLYDYQGNLIEVVPSFGFAIAPIEGHRYQDLYVLADKRMFEDKKAIKALYNRTRESK